MLSFYTYSQGRTEKIGHHCVLVCYGTEVKGYQLCDPDRNKMLYSRNVKFNEEELGIKKEGASVEPVKVVSRLAMIL